MRRVEEELRRLAHAVRVVDRIGVSPPGMRLVDAVREAVVTVPGDVPGFPAVVVVALEDAVDGRCTHGEELPVRAPVVRDDRAVHETGLREEILRGDARDEAIRPRPA